MLLWLVASWGFSTYISQVSDVGAIYGAFTGAILLVAWLWLTNVALLFGAELERRDRAPAGAAGRRALTPHAQPAGPPGLAGDVLEDQRG